MGRRGQSRRQDVLVQAEVGRLEQRERVAVAPGGSVAGHEEVPGDSVPGGHCVEQLAGKAEAAALTVEGYEVVVLDDVEMGGSNHLRVDCLACA